MPWEGEGEGEGGMQPASLLPGGTPSQTCSVPAVRFQERHRKRGKLGPLSSNVTMLSQSLSRSAKMCDCQFKAIIEGVS